MFKMADSSQHFYTNWHPLHSIRQWTSDELNVSLCPLAVLTIQYITTAFLPTTSFGFTMLLGLGPPSAGMMSLCLATAKGPQALQMCLFYFIMPLWSGSFCLISQRRWSDLCQKISHKSLKTEISMPTHSYPGFRPPNCDAQLRIVQYISSVLPTEAISTSLSYQSFADGMMRSSSYIFS